MSFNISSIPQCLSQPTPFLGLKLWATIIICLVMVLTLVLIITLFSICLKTRKSKTQSSDVEISKNVHGNCTTVVERRFLSRKGWDIEISIETPDKKVMYSDHHHHHPSSNGNGIIINDAADKECLASVNKYNLRDIEIATNGFCRENLIGTGNHGVVFHGILACNSQVAIKNLFISNRTVNGFIEEAEKMWLIRHKNLVKLLGYCAEETYMYRMLVYEHVDNGNLKQWLHGCVNDVSPLTWNIRMKIIIGIAKGLAYLHEDIEPAIVHQNLKSSNVLLDQQWNPKISDFGIIKFFVPVWNPVLAPPTGMSGYIAPECAHNRVLDKKSDVYSFGILLMEIISGKTSTISSFNEIEEYLVDWIKSMVAEEKYDVILDPKLPEFPCAKELKRIVLIALRCVDFEAEKRPKMGEIIHMMEPRDLLLSDEQVSRRPIFRRNSSKNHHLP